MSRGRLDQRVSNMWERQKMVGGFETLLTEDVPIILANAVAGFASSDGRKFEGAVNERVRVCYIKPLPIGEEIVSMGIIVRCVGWANEMCFGA